MLTWRRVGLDRAAVDATDDAAARWQLACVWPDTGRLDRTRLALDEARRARLTLVECDAASSSQCNVLEAQSTK